ncbi:Glycosyl transferase, family 4, conserved region [Thermovirga lienii DSM 17291]|jgi:UDP-GlcNAc:undecaprenyl-phosphate GlcNAc-1-phosphate transferase|uniref:Glycosyl transferase, family 4, conserved region n=1 Tax=Thermovirga lienii (strain ATCC BAA-1197 / DSM 17291 / Cas60314) TaxID=580340 RepID=G7VA90_THELD|nr:Glycosyl transferase, family 4, conserved region [Thermovirga lienii DSM 17291]KUK43068.1 MAG: Glycosyl transferase, family 4, conserved region [Thermovirga lienii]MDN5367402.1 UDP-GlcNAc:undecaprenyl-phosphate/decaprenyl-phosphate GlcNAc-phosphate transferase [Thermovirga sp.]HCD71863.1 undecaprenyl/decaprenyl-phosphate alpha-N-acetylglucosaminyl 1-phosphate transferase [Thermovirga lienii]
MATQAIVLSWKNAAFLSLLFFAWGIAATPLSIALAKTFRIVDMPGGRKKHKGIIPRGGGLTCWIGYLFLSFVLLGIYPEMAPIATGATVVFLVGYVDDMRQLPAWVKLFFHLLASTFIVCFLPVSLPLRALLVLWIAGATNAYNLIDGVNGLALSLFMLSCVLGAITTKIGIFFPLAAMALGVFFWNFPVAKTFLGDGGSTLLGFLCMGHLSFAMCPLLVERSPIIIVLSLFLIGGVPFLDTFWVASRRIVLRKSPFTPDRGHIHFILLDKGLKIEQTLFLLLLIHGCIIAMGYGLILGKISLLSYF